MQPWRGQQPSSASTLKDMRLFIADIIHMIYAGQAEERLRGSNHAPPTPGAAKHPCSFRAGASAECILCLYTVNLQMRRKRSLTCSCFLTGMKYTLITIPASIHQHDDWRREVPQILTYDTISEETNVQAGSPSSPAIGTSLKHCSGKTPRK